MQLDMTQFPLIWMREHSDDHEQEEDAAAREALLALLERGEKFVLIATRLPTLAELAELKPEDKKMRAKLFKTHRAQLTRLCAGMIMIGSAANLPQPICKAVQGFTAMMGVAVFFAASVADADAIARERLATN
jgi:hypothetical protein